MPIVTEDCDIIEGFSGLRRYAVFTFIKDPDYSAKHPKKGTSFAKRFTKCPLVSASEAASKLPHTELFHMKRLQGLEKPSEYPYIDVTFFSTYNGGSEIYSLIEAEDCVNMYDPKIPVEKACFEELQLVDPKRDMIQTPIDINDPITEFQTKGICVNPKQEETTTEEKNLRGYIIIAYRTMEDMYNREFVSSWKTWTGVRYICMQLPRQLGLRRISFYRQLANTSAFTYVLVIEISNLLVYAAETLNLMDKIKLRLCGWVGVFKETEFKLDQVTAGNLGLATDFENHPRSKGTPSISVTRMESREDLDVHFNTKKRSSIDSNILLDLGEEKENEIKGELESIQEINVGERAKENKLEIERADEIRVSSEKHEKESETRRVVKLWKHTKTSKSSLKATSLQQSDVDETEDTVSLLPKAGNKLKERMGVLAHKLGHAYSPTTQRSKKYSGSEGSGVSSGESTPKRRISAAQLQSKIAKAAGKSASRMRGNKDHPQEKVDLSSEKTTRAPSSSGSKSSKDNSQKLLKGFPEITLNKTIEDIIIPTPIPPPPPPPSIISVPRSTLRQPLEGKTSNVSDSSVASMNSIDTKPTGSRDPSVEFQSLNLGKSLESTLEREHKMETESQVTDYDNTTLERPPAPMPFPSPSKFIGHGRIYNPNMVAVPPMIQASNPLYPPGPPASMGAYRPYNYISPYNQRRQSVYLGGAQNAGSIRQNLQNTGHRHNLVSDLPSAREQLAPAYPSIFQRNVNIGGWDGPRPQLPPPPNFASIAANYPQRYNSPVYSREDWKEETNLYDAQVAQEENELNQNTMMNLIGESNSHSRTSLTQMQRQSTDSSESTRACSMDRNYNSPPNRMRRFSYGQRDPVPPDSLHLMGHNRVVGSLSDLRNFNLEEEEADLQRRRQSAMEKRWSPNDIIVDAMQREPGKSQQGQSSAEGTVERNESLGKEVGRKRSLRRKKREDTQESTNLPLELARIMFTNTSERSRHQRRRALPRTPSGTEINRMDKRSPRRSARSPDPPRRNKTTFGHVLWP